jgi:hypothetical protein
MQFSSCMLTMDTEHYYCYVYYCNIIISMQMILLINAQIDVFAYMILSLWRKHD